MSVLPPSDFRVMITTTNRRRVVAAPPTATSGKAGKNRMGYKADKDEEDEQPRKKAVSDLTRQQDDILSNMPDDDILGIMAQLSYEALKHYCRTNKYIHSICMSSAGKRITLQKYKEHLKTLDTKIKRLIALIRELLPTDGRNRVISLVGLYEDGTIVFDLDEILANWDDLCIHYGAVVLKRDDDSEWDLLAKDAKYAHRIGDEGKGHRCSTGRTNFGNKQTAIYTLAYKVFPMIDPSRKLMAFREKAFDLAEGSKKNREDYVFDTLLDAIHEAREGVEDEALALLMERLMKIMYGIYDIGPILEEWQSRKG